MHNVGNCSKCDVHPAPCLASTSPFSLYHTCVTVHGEQLISDGVKYSVFDVTLFVVPNLQ